MQPINHFQPNQSNVRFQTSTTWYDALSVSKQLNLNPTIPHYENLCAALGAAVIAGDILRQGYGIVHRIERKGQGDLVSTVDKDAEAAIVRYLHTSSCSRCISEEFAINQTLTDEPTWIIDPLDGSSAYLYQSHPKDPSVMIALVENKEPVCSVVYRPMINELWYAVKGHGCFCDQDLISVSKTQQVLQDLRVILNQYGDQKYDSKFLRRLRNALRTAKGTQHYEIPLPASSFALDVMKTPHFFGAVIHDNNRKKVKQEMWDTLPIQLMVEEAGGIFMGAHSGGRYQFERPEPIIVAPSPLIAQQIRSLGGL